MQQFVRQTRPLFVSSTFDDFHSERDLLTSIVFPELAERLGRRWYDFEPVDLRLGVDTMVHADEAAKSRLVMQVCLQEVARSRPFVLGMIGDRYGWVVPDELARMAAEESGFEGPTAGRSMTDLELQFGVLQERGTRDSVGARVYVRELDLSGAPDEVRARFTDAAGGAGRLRELKSELLERLGPTRCREYRAVWDARQARVAGLTDFRAMVTEDLWEDLDLATSGARAVAVGWEARERAVLDEFFHHSAADFVGRTNLLRDLREFATTRQAAAAAARVCAVTGVPGSGKSSLAAELVRRLRASEDLVVLDHAAGISGVAGSVDTMLRRWLTELPGGTTATSVDDLAGADLERAFARALTRVAAQRPVVIVVDAVDEFEQSVRARRMTWLPKIWPQDAKLVFTATPGDDVESVVRRTGALPREVGPLGSDEAAELVDAIYRRYRRHVNRSVKQAILEKRTADGASAHGSPLWLELVCQEMNLLNAEDFARSTGFPGRADERLTAMQLAVLDELPSTPQEMYLRMMRRAETVAEMAISASTESVPQQGSVWFRGLIQLLALGRQGWRESDLRAVMGSLTGVQWNDLLFSSVRRVFRGHLVQRGAAGQWDFSHSQFRTAARQAYALPPSRRQDLHRRIAAHLADLHPDDVHRQRELMHHLVGADDRLGAARLYAGTQPTTDLARSATESLAARYHAGPDGRPWVASLLAQDGLGFLEKLQLGHMMLRPLDARLTSDGVGTDERRLLLELIRDSAALAAKSATTPMARGLAERQHAVALLRLADLAMDTGDQAAAKVAYEQVVEINHRAARRSTALPLADFDLAVAVERLGTFAMHEGRPGEAKHHFSECAQLFERLISQGSASLGEACMAYGTVLQNLAELSLREGLPATAEAHYARMAALEPHLDGSPHLVEFRIRTTVNLARLAESTDRLSDAGRHYTEAEDIARRAAEEASEDVESQRRWLHILSSLGDIELARRHLAQATHWYLQALEGFRRLAVVLPDDIPTQQHLAAALARYGDALMNGRTPEDAREVFHQSLRIRSHISTLLPNDVEALRDVGLACERVAALADQSPEDAIGHLRRAVEIYRQLQAARPGREEEPRTLAIALFALGREMLRTGPRRSEGHEVLSEAHSILGDLRARGVPLHPEGKRVLSLLDTMFGGSGRWTHTVRPSDRAAYAELNARGRLGQQALNRGDFAEAEEEYGEALALARSIDHPPSVARAMGSLGQVALARQEPQRATELLRSAAEYAHAHGLTDEENVTLSLLARLDASAGDDDSGLRTTLARIELTRRTGNASGLGRALGTAAEYYINAQQFDRALPLLEEAVEVFGQYRMDADLASAYMYLGWTLQELGRTDEAADAFLQHIELSAVPDLEPQVNVGFLLAAVGRWDEAIEQATRAVARLEAEGTGPVEELRGFIADWVRERDGGK
ncbi:hypothetical protein ADK57_33880 [Streptomyces sp. MMG1533]|uniref:tetratricopeptide repeat protein n=1 Tax=Streptomyces sp. MMG1533 TaxID=1415546 RepID=UPI0006AF300C|nr:tetratricopeptide repeat protein [Streptomyces sp. MMG1533]KOU59346.1 hypothetical protein ADK57_33880 [Streptomyces sp. MMG1533]